MSQYESLARFYDELTYDVPYERFADFYEAVFSLYGKSPKMILDLACGTGNLACLLAERGYDMIAVDESEDMLAEAMDKMVEFEGKRPLFLCQSLEELDLYGTVEAAVCCLDGFNYIHIDDLKEVFRRLNLFIEPGGILVFDINSPYKLRGLDGRISIDETDDVYCVWRSDFDEEENCIVYGMDIFSQNDDGSWDRESEEHCEYAHSVEELTAMLKKSGFKNIKVFGELVLEKPKDDEMRIFISAENTR